MINLSHVTKQYRVDNETVISPVRDVNLTIDAGEFVLIVGRSGSGKTTLLNLAAGLVRPTSGHASFDGQNLWELDDTRLSQLRARKIGFMFQFPSLLPTLTALENILLPTRFSRHLTREQVNLRAGDLLEMVGLADRTEAFPHQLSGGEQRRVVIARALINAPEVLIADEPTGDLDEETERDIMKMLRDIHSRGMTVLMASHNLDPVSFADRVLRIENGGLHDLAVMRRGPKNGRNLLRTYPDTTFAQ